MSRIKKTRKQTESIDLIANNETSLLEGGSRSGKTFIIIFALVVRALKYPNTWHLAARLRRTHAKQSLWNKTIPDVLNLLGIKKEVNFNYSDLIVEFPNKSLLLVDGLDDKDRIEKILGNEYATIFINEVSQISYDSYDLLTTRLNPPKGVPAKFLMDYNPPSTAHWGYQLFHKRQRPDGRKIPDDDYGHIRINPADNIENLSEFYLSRLDNLSGNKKKRFRDGKYTTEEGALWKRGWIKYDKGPESLVRVVVGVDPSGSKGGDEIGIIVVGLSRTKNIYVLDDYSLHGTPKEWSDEVCRAYRDHMADVVVAEKNYGGEMVKSTITQIGRKQINVKLVSATRGKDVRAEPISALYQEGRVYHTKEFTSLEDELCTWKSGDDSPNRLDALVWAITKLIPGLSSTALSDVLEDFRSMPDRDTYKENIV